MQIFRYEPPGKFIRVYIPVVGVFDTEQVDQDEIWSTIKAEALGVEPGDEAHYYDCADEEAEVRATFFTGFHDTSNWSPMGSVAVDSHY